MIALPSKLDTVNMMNWLIANPNEYTLVTHTYTYDWNEYTSYDFILNEDYTEGIIGNVFTSNSGSYDIIMYANKSGEQDKNFVTICKETYQYSNDVDYCTTLGTGCKDLRWIYSVSPRGGQVLIIENNKLTQYIPSGTGMSSDYNDPDITVAGKTYTSAHLSLGSVLKRNTSENNYYVPNYLDYAHQYHGLSRQFFSSINGILFDSPNIKIGEHIEVDKTVYDKLLKDWTFEFEKPATSYDNFYDLCATHYDNSTILRFDAINNIWADYMTDLYNVYDSYRWTSDFFKYVGDSEEPGLELDSFISVSSTQLHTVIDSARLTTVQSFVNNRNLINTSTSVSSMYSVVAYWYETITYILIKSFPEFLEFLPKLSYISKLSDRPILNATVYNPNTQQTTTYEDILNDVADYENLNITLTHSGRTVTENVSSSPYSCIIIFAYLGLFNPSSNNIVTITKG